MLNARGVAIIAVLDLLLASNALAAGKLSHAEVVGSIAGAQGNVLVDRQPIIAKEAVFSGDVVTTGVASGAYLNLRGATAILVENGELALGGGTGTLPMAGHGQARPERSEWDAHVTPMTLTKGAVVIRTSDGEAARVNVRGGYVLVGGAGTPRASVRIAAAGASAVVIADRGQAEIHGSGAPSIVRAGKTVRMENGVPQGSAQIAGVVHAQIPTGYLNPPGETPPPLTASGTPLKLNDQIPWGDWIVTPVNGRVQILLGDNSYLNIGARSRMHVIKHDGATHETELYLAAGSMKAAVVKAAGTKFKATTPTAVIGVQGTELDADVISPTQTNVANISEANSGSFVTVGSTNPSVTTFVTLRPGEMVSVFPSGFSAVGNLTSGIARSMESKTNVQGGLTGPAGGTLTGAGTTTLGNATNTLISSSKFVSVGASVAGAGVAGGAAAAASSASSTFSNAASTEGNATTAANAASSAATQTTTIENTTTIQIQQQQGGCGCPSPSYPH